jgi:hypothetical protein
MNTNSSSSYYFSVLKTFSNVYWTYQNNGPFYFESLIEYTSDVNLSDVQTEISELSNDILILQNDPGEIERIVRLEDKTQYITTNSSSVPPSTIFNCDISLFNGYWFSFNQDTGDLQLKNQNGITTLTLTQ